MRQRLSIPERLWNGLWYGWRGLRPNPITLSDDAGNEYLSSARRRLRELRRSGEISKDQLDALRRAIFRRVPAADPRMSLIVFVCAIWAAVVVMHTATVGFTKSDYLWLLCIVTLTPWAIYVRWFGLPVVSLEILGDVLFEQGLCPVCAYDLRGLSPGPDGFVACAECGAKWHPVHAPPRP